MACRMLSVLLVAGLAAVAGCDDDEGPESERFEATLTGGAERPNPVTTQATGRATFEVQGASVAFEIEAEQLTDAFAAHIHGPAGTDAAAGILVTLFMVPQASAVDVADGTLESGTFPGGTFTLNNVTLDSVLVLMRNGNAYVNVHTVANQGGEIRGQVEQSN